MAIVGGIIVAAIGILLTHRLTVNHERKKQKATDNTALQKEIATPKEKIAYYEDVEQSPTGDYLILKHTQQAVCPVCWGREHTAIPLYGNGPYYTCGSRKTFGVFDRQAFRHAQAEQEQENQRGDLLARQLL